MKFTKGPWRVGQLQSRPGKIDLLPVGHPEYTVASIHCYGDNAKANAALIAAAPDLYAALEACLHDLAILASRDPENIRAQRYENAKLAISKAEGRYE